MSDDGWRYSTEGDLDPDLTEEAGYADWEAPDRGWLAPVLRAVMALVLAAFILGIVLRVL
jgi:hypothetical protein